MEQITNKLDKVEHLIRRNVSEIITQDELKSHLQSERQLKIYLGVDPSSHLIHLGHAVVLWKLREFQDLGHNVILLIGDFTAQIGDPTGKSKERVPLTHEQVLQNAATYKEQASKILSFEGENAAKMMFNSEWLAKLTFKEVIDLASYFTVSQMIERDMFQERLKANQAIGLHEFLYPLMVGYDCVYLDVDVEVGGNDQLFNIKAGRILMEKMKSKKKVVLVCDLLTGSDGSKMSKSAGNVIPISATPEDMFGKLMAVADTLISEYALLASDMSEEEIEDVKSRLSRGENPRDVKLNVAERIVARYYPEEAKEARESWKKSFSDGDVASSAVEVTMNDLESTLTRTVSFLHQVSGSDARRLIEQGAVDVEEETVRDPNKIMQFDPPKVIRIGKHRVYKAIYRG